MRRSASHSSYGARTTAWALIVGFSLLLGGCATWNWRGKGFGNNEGTWAQKMRPPADEKRFSGLDARAQEIERNLGVR